MGFNLVIKILATSFFGYFRMQFSLMKFLFYMVLLCVIWNINWGTFPNFCTRTYFCTPGLKSFIKTEFMEINWGITFF